MVYPSAIVAIARGELALVDYSPRLNAAGNCVRGMMALQAISQSLKLSLFRTDRE